MVPALLSLPISYTGRSPYTAVPLAFAVYLGALILFTLAYRLSPFHPLAKYPGPVIAKTSKWWAAYISAKGHQHRCFKRLHDRWGDVVRIGLGNIFHLLSMKKLTHCQVRMNSPSAMLPLSIPYSAKVACPKDHVCTSHDTAADCPHGIIRLGGSAWQSVIDCSARSREALASTQALESSVFIHSFEGVRSYCGKSY
jgi:hypothetical protein